MIDQHEVERWARRFRAGGTQVRRDHRISHVLAALGGLASHTQFFGGTALCRTYLDGTRLSEDIDLLDADPATFMTRLRRELPRAVRRELPDCVMADTVPEGTGVSARLTGPGIDAVKVYVGRRGADSREWEFVRTDVNLRYSDLPESVEFECPTLATFAAMKLEAWYDRHAPRDLFDLAGLADHPDLDVGRVEALLTGRLRHGFVGPEMDRIPRATRDAWETELAAQAGALPSPDECLLRARRRFGRPPTTR